MKNALIFDGKVVQVQVRTFLVAPPLIWVSCQDEITTDYLYDIQTETFSLPDPPPVDRVEEIKSALVRIDQASIRATRAILKSGNGTADDIQYLDDLEAQAVILRSELAGLE